MIPLLSFNPRCLARLAGCATVAFAALVAHAQTDEIQVYDANIVEQGKFNLTLHDNYTPAGQTTPAFPGALIADHSFNGVPEWAYGVAPWFEAGLYLPLYSVTRNRGPSLNGFKLRTLFVEPHAEDHTFIYGMNFEYSYNAKYWEENSFSGEMRPIIGWHWHPVDFIVNPILDTEFDSTGKLEFVPCERLALNLSEKWAVAAEEYADYGPLDGLRSWKTEVHQVYGVVDHHGKSLDVEFGVGVGLTRSSDQCTLKLILSHDF